MSEDLKCPICGKPTFIYFGSPRKDRLCKEHGTMSNKGEIEQCPECGKWNKTGETCECKKNTHKEEPKNNLEELTCIICGKPSNGKHFCVDCWKKYHSKTIDIRIEYCKDTKIIDAYGNKDTKTANGLYVRSIQEKVIYDELFRRGIKCEYERTISYKNEQGELKELHPDFYLTDYKIYIEHWGYLDSRNKQYEEEKSFKEKIYKSKGYKLAATTSADIKDIQAAIERILVENDITVE